MKPTNPLARYEYKLARETRRLAAIDLRKTEVQTVGAHGMAEVLIFRTIGTRAMWAIVAIFTCVTITSINDVFQNRDQQAQITACEKAVTQAHIEVADCSTGEIGEAKK